MSNEEYEARYQELMTELKPLLEKPLQFFIEHPDKWKRSNDLQNEILDLIEKRVANNAVDSRIS